jgi:outer membrane assembly lipoprotein YfiO
LLFALALPISCHPAKPVVNPVPTAPDELLNQGMKQLKDRQYGKAIVTFQQMTYDFATTHYATEAQFYLAEAYRLKKDYAQAQLEYEFLTTNFPSSPFYEEASYRTALCYLRAVPKSSLDQSGLKKAQDLIDLFKEQFPNSKYLSEIEIMETEIAARFAQKEYDAGMLYAGAGEYESARIYFQHILATWPRATLVPEVKLQLAIAYQGLANKDLARLGFDEIINGSFDPKLQKKARDHRARMEPEIAAVPPSPPESVPPITPTPKPDTGLKPPVVPETVATTVPPPEPEVQAGPSEAGAGKSFFPDTGMGAVFFGQDSTRIHDADTTMLRANIEYLKNHPGLEVLLVGYCDSVGEPEHNLLLGLRRAQAVRRRLIAEGIEASRISVHSLGSEWSFDTEPDLMWQDRRCEFWTRAR